MWNRAFAATAALLPLVCSSAIPGDEVPAKDYPGVGRIAGYVAQAYDVKKFDALEFQLKGDTFRVEGRKIYGSYTCRPGPEQECESALGAQKEFESALTKLGGEIIVRDPASEEPNAHLVGRFGVGSQLVYLDVRPWNSGEGYDLTILEERDFESSMQGGTSGSSADLRSALRQDGKAIVHIRFDFDKAVLRPDAAPIIQQIAAAMQADPTMKLEIAGHTDGIGTDGHNKALSKQRADAVVAAVQAAGIPAARMTSAGYGATVPLSDNTTSDGRAQNRRVELVKK